MQIIYEERAYRKIMYWVDKATGEVSGFGYLKVNDDGDIVVYDAFLVEQDCTGSNTEMTDEGVAKAMVDAHGAGELDNMKLWWHSHADMDVFWSGTDEECIRSIGGSKWWLSSVFNKKKKSKNRIDVFRPMQMTTDDLPLRVAYEEREVKRELREQLELFAQVHDLGNDFSDNIMKRTLSSDFGEFFTEEEKEELDDQFDDMVSESRGAYLRRFANKNMSGYRGFPPSNKRGEATKRNWQVSANEWERKRRRREKELDEAFEDYGDEDWESFVIGFDEGDEIETIGE